MSTLLLKVNGLEYSNFKSASVTLQLDTLADQFSFTAVSVKKVPVQINIGDACEIEVNDKKVLTGNIEIIDVDYDSESHDISISGRSKTGDLVDSFIDTLELLPPITLKEVIEKVLINIGLDIKVIDNATGLKPFTKSEDKITPKVGENAFTFIEKLARKRQVLLTSDENGNIVIVKPNSNSAPRDLQNIINGFDNNIKSGSVSRDSTSTYGKYLVRSQLNLSTLNFAGDVKSKEIVNQKSQIITDSKFRPSRRYVIQAESASSDGENENRAKWEANIRETRSIVYSVTLEKYDHKGKLWNPNQVVSVIDDFAKINNLMLINSVTFTKEYDFTETTLSLVSENAYTLKLREPDKSKASNAGNIPEFN